MKGMLEDNCSVGQDARVDGGVRNGVAIGARAVCDESDLVVLGNADTRKLRVAGMELFADENGLGFVHLKTGRRFRVELKPE